MIDFDDIDNFFCSSSTKKRVQFSIARSYNTLCEMLEGLPEHGEQWRLVSPRGGWSSCSLLEYIANETTVHDCFIATLRVGKKELDKLCSLVDFGQVENAKFMLSDLANENKSKSGKSYDYQQYFEQKCEEYDFEKRYAKNHAKLILLDTDDGKIVVETSSNFNENPKIEQFCITNDASVYDWYLAIIENIE